MVQLTVPPNGDRVHVVFVGNRTGGGGGAVRGGGYAVVYAVTGAHGRGWRVSN